MIKEIEARIRDKLKNGRFLLCDQDTLANGDMTKLLQGAFELSSVQLIDATCVLSEKLTLTGTAPDLQNAVITVVFCVVTPSCVDVVLSQKMPDSWKFPLDSHDLFYLTSASRRFCIRTKENELHRMLTGDVVVDHLRFSADGNYVERDANWVFDLVAKEQISAQSVFDVFFALLNIPSIPIDFFGNAKILQLSYHYETKSQVKKVWDNMSIQIVTNAEVPVVDGLRFKQFGFQIDKRGSRYDLAFTADLVIGNSTFPICINYQNSRFIFGIAVDPQHPCKIPSIEELAQIAKIKLNGILPSEILRFDQLMLDVFTVGLAPNFQSVHLLEVMISTKNNWSFFSVKSLILSNLKFGFRYDPSETIYAIYGTITIGENANLVVELGASHSSDYGWVFRGCVPVGHPCNLKILAFDLAKMLELSIPELPIPDIMLDYADVTFHLKDSQFTALAKVSVAATKAMAGESSTILDKLFQIKASVQIVSALEHSHTYSDAFAEQPFEILSANARTYKGEFIGELDIDPVIFQVSYQFGKAGGNVITATLLPSDEIITLTKILTKFGVTDIPPIVESLNLGIYSVIMTYNVSTENLHMEIKSTCFGDISVDVIDKSYRVDIQFQDDIRLSNLPLVGNHLHLLDSVAIQKLHFIASTKDIANPPVKSGLALLGNVLNNDFTLQLYHKENHLLPEAAENANAEYKWIDIHKSLGIFEFSRLGVGYKDSQITFLLDAGLVTKPIRLDLMSLGIGFDVTNPQNFQLYLSGLGVDFKSGNLILSGAFLKSNEQETYEGNILISFGKISLFAAGMYSGESLMVYALLSAPIGGCPAIFITGLAAGFGYNVNIKMPEISEVAQFPLVGAAIGSIKREEIPSKMKGCLTTQKGQNFLAAGVKFTSFNLAESFVLAVVTFGNHLELGVLGLSKISMPPNLASGENPLVYAELALKAFLAPEAGLLSVMAQLTSESYLFSKDCKLTGGFAFNLWFSGEHSGDFVITLGGYHPAYQKPAHYPDVPRLGIYWPIIPGKLDITGNLYFALTPSVLMAGGRLSAVYRDGGLKAWFNAMADFFVAWKPFHYDVNISIIVGASYRVDFAFVHETFRVELGADVHLWGPEFSGKAHISWFIISFDIAFGAGSTQKPNPLCWDEFKKSFLAKPDKTPNQMLLENPSVNPITLSVAKGLRFEAGKDTCGLAAAEKQTFPVVFADQLLLQMKSAVPATAMFLNGTAISVPVKQLGVLPMGEKTALQTTLKVRLLDKAGNQVACKQTDLLIDNVPSALWGFEKTDKQLIAGAALGMAIQPVQKDYPLVPKVGWIDVNALSVYGNQEKTFGWNQSWKLRAQHQDHTKQLFSNTVMSEEVQINRKALIESLQSAGFSFNSEINLSRLKADVESLFHEDMQLARIGWA